MRIFLTMIVLIVLLGIAWHVIQTSPEATFGPLFGAFSATTTNSVVVAGTQHANAEVSLPEVVAPATVSSGAVRIVSVRGEFAVPEITLHAETVVDITGWHIRTREVTFEIPQIARTYTPGPMITLSDVRVKSGDRISIFGSESPIGVGFRADGCADVSRQNYENCVQAPQYYWPENNSRSEVRLYSGSRPLVDPYHDQVRLFDAEGVLIDTFAY